MNKKLLIVAIAALLSQGVIAGNFPEPIALPGYTWGSLQYPGTVVRNVPDNDALLFSGRTEQGADWFKFGSSKEFTFNTFLAVNYSADTAQLPWNNYLRPQIGMKVRHAWTNGGMGELGVAYAYEKRYNTNYNGIQTPQDGAGVMVYYNFYTNWDLKRSN